MGDLVAPQLLRFLRKTIAFEFYSCFHSMPHEYVELRRKFSWFQNLFPAVLTLNWDPLFEDLLSDHGFPPIDIVIGSEAGPNERILLQLHGSVNWFILSGDLDKDVRSDLKPFLYKLRSSKPGKKGPALYGLLGFDQLCRMIDRDELWDLRGLLLKVAEPALSMPSHRTSLTALMLDHLWASAAAILDNADNLIVIGYSLPEDDSHMHGLLRRWTRVRENRGLASQIILIDPNAGTLVNRYVRVVGNEVTIIPIQKTFARLTRGEIEFNLLERAS